jgi:hypothetical protein
MPFGVLGAGTGRAAIRGQYGTWPGEKAPPSLVGSAAERMPMVTVPCIHTARQPNGPQVLR